MHPDKPDSDEPEGDEPGGDEPEGDKPEGKDPEGEDPGGLDPALAAAHAAVVAREERRLIERRLGIDRRRAQRPLAQPGWLALATVSWLLVIFAALSPPAFLRPAGPAPYQPPPALTEASLRYGLWLAQHRVQAFYARERRLPSFLAEAGADDEALRLEVTGASTYRLVATAGDLQLELHDAMAADSFLGDALRMLRGD